VSKIEVLYNCNECKVEKRPVSVPARESLEVDVVEWVHSSIELCGLDHLVISPYCGSRRLDMMIPMSEEKWIGQA
jgi:DNA-directed RNA polymerase subunit RPC12/RpoP